MSDHDVLVVGGGIGALSAGLRCASDGARVHLLERAQHLGGKMRTVNVGPFEIDSGPTVLTMRTVFEDLFAYAGLRMDDYVELDRLDVLARHFWRDGSQLDLMDNVEANVAAIEAFAGRREAQGFVRFTRHVGKIHERVRAPFLDSPKQGLLASARSAGIRGAFAFARVDWHRSIWKALGDFFRDPRLRQLFARYATYVGSSPFQAPATLNLIAHVESRGVWTVRGGMQNLARAIGQAFSDRGGSVELGAEVSEILTDRGRAVGVRMSDGTCRFANAVVFGGDPGALRQGLVGNAATQAVPVASSDRSLSAMTFGWAAQAKGRPLSFHNVFFSDDYPHEFESLFEHQRIPRQPTVYVCAPHRATTPPSSATNNRSEPLFALINAPAIADREGVDFEIPQCKTATLDQLRHCGLHIEAIDHEVVTTPTEFAQRFPGSHGALYGPATHAAMGAFSRPGHMTNVQGLYLAGGGAHPGAGVPMVALSGRWAAEAIAADLGSTFQPPVAATAGGTSTR